ncbi:hypothetical protein [Streptomyces sp. NPDC048419]|uniref:hypothetical protein n=1 Tax=Streptomyces sp. NPDC048419 TaxID=3365547 RepID=UPI003714E1BD
MRASPLGVVDRVDGVALLPREQRVEALHRLHEEMARIRTQDGAVHGTGAHVPASDASRTDAPVPPAR